MKANELMIGDWVKTPKGFFQVNGIQDNDVIGTDYNNGEGADSLFFIDEIEPIPLTADILEKNGFEKQWQYNYEYFDDDENLNITFNSKSTNYTNGAYDYIDIEKGCLTINEMPIAFVHELQHALKLCGSGQS